jgi:prolyl-tRNA editing enzyme YbaK/EbsC (Cys-tRNA(Pro) deacylase)
MILDFYSVNWIVLLIVGRIGKVGRDVVKTLIVSDNQAFHTLIINPFDNQTVSLP